MSEERKKERCKRKDIALKVVNGFLEKDCDHGTELYYSLETVLDYIEKLEKDNKVLALESQGLFESINCNEDTSLSFRYKKLKKENEELKGALERDIYARDCLAKHSISKNKIRDKIKELEEYRQAYYKDKKLVQEITMEIAIDRVKELLGEN